MTIHRLALATLAAAALGAVPAAWALQISSFSPQGEVARIRQAVAKFDGPAVRFGDPAAPAPLAVRCSDTEAGKGSGRWTSDREWVFDFAADLPPGVSCTVQAVSAFKSASGQPLAMANSYKFNSGGPFVVNTWPGTYRTIDEEQFFVLQLNGAATAASVQQNVWCAVDGLGERVPVRAIEGAQRAAVLKATGLALPAGKTPLAYATLACNRRLPPGGKLSIVFGTGVSTPSGIPNTVEKRFTWTVREPFSAEFSCERENAQAACLPIRPMSLRFNAPVTRQQAGAIRLRGGSQAGTPVLEGDTARAYGHKPPDGDSVVSALRFTGPFDESTAYTLELPAGFQDAAGRTLRNASSYPLQVRTGALPPLAKFAAAPFGVVERFAEPNSEKTGKGMLPVTLRKVEGARPVQGLAPGAPAVPAGTVSDLRPQSDAEIIRWMEKLQRYDAGRVLRHQARKDVSGPLPAALPLEDSRRLSDRVETRSVSLLAGQPGVKTLDLPRTDGADPRPFEVVGIPLDPGFHVVEIASQRLGEALLDGRYGAQRPMFVRTGTLVTNLGVHFKLGRENAAVWVTSLDKGLPVAGAAVQVSDCSGKALATGTTDAQGLARIEGLSPEAPRCNGENDWDYRRAYFVSARARSAGADDMAFTWSDWQRGIEPWRFNVPTSQAHVADLRAHTVFDRTLLRAGETVSMKHYLRTETRTGFGLPARWPATLVVTHVGSGQQFTQPLAWRSTGTGGRSAESSFTLPPAAKLGSYSVELRLDDPPAARPGEDGDGAGRSLATGNFRVEEFRLPVFEGRIAPVQQGPLVDAKAVPLQLRVGYVAGGGAARLPVRVSALVRPRSIDFPDVDGFNFAPPRPRADAQSRGADDDAGEETPEAATGTRVVADKLPLVLDAEGNGKLSLPELPAAAQPRDLLVEATYTDPNGELQTIRGTSTLWPAGVVVGLKTEGWVSVHKALRMQALALDLAGKPKKGVALSVRAVSRTVTTSRKRMVGGFYTYDNSTDTQDLGEVCSGKSDSRGLLQCETQLKNAGQVELIVTAKDGDGRSIQAGGTVYVTRQGEIWFGGEDHDRIDVLPEKKSYEPGETARLQVRMPFRQATALVAVEREGILETQVVQLRGQDPTVEIKVKEGWGPNVYISVLALRGRLREVPWYSFFTWGFKAPREWWTAFRYEGKEYVAPTALVDLSKPAYRLGMAEIRVGTKAHRIDVKVVADKESYPVRGTAKVTVRATLPDGKPAAGAEVALAAVDQALLELMPNTSWNLLEAMLQRRAWGVQTSTAQMEIVGRRHFGRKAVPAGGGGGRSATRELLDTLLLWNPRVVLDAAGQAQVDVPLNDALTSFRIVAVADAGTGSFGTGQNTIRATQDLQIISGLPPLVREGDEFRAQITLRNTTAKPMTVEATARATLLDLPSQTVDIAAGGSREVSWNVTAPEQLGQTRAEALLWDISARDTATGATARDALKARQRIVPAVPLAVQQATLVQLDGPYRLDVAAPAGALPATGAKRGGIQMMLQPKLAEGLPGVRDWFAHYPFLCLEQKTSKAVGLADGALWKGVAAELPTYLDKDGLASYFPPREGQDDRGSDTLTAYLLAATHEASALHPEFVLPQAERDAMARGLAAFVEGRIQRNFWSPQKDLDVRKIAAVEALSRYGLAQGRMVGSVTVAPNQWPTHAVIDWLNILKRVQDVPQRAQRLEEAQQILRGRLSYQGTKLVFSTEEGDYWWWLMANGDANTAKLMLAVMDDPAWKDDMGRLANGFIARQQGGAWHTTTANLWGGLALEKFSAKFESKPVTGTTRATLGDASAQVDWSKVVRAKPADAGDAPHQRSVFGAPASPTGLLNNGMFLPWPAGSAGATGAAAAAGAPASSNVPPAGAGTLEVQQQGTGKAWLTVQSLAAVPRTAPFAAGYAVTKTVTAVEQAQPGRYTRGDVLRVVVEVNASAPMTWVVLSDPIPGGATILGSGLGRDSEIAAQAGRKDTVDPGAAWLAYEERSFEAFRAYYDYVPKGVFKVEYTVRLNNVGAFSLPATRVEAMYAPEMFGEVPNARVTVQATP